MNTQVYFRLMEACYDPGDDLAGAETIELCLSSESSFNPGSGTYVGVRLTPEKLEELIGVLYEARIVWENAMDGI